MRKIKAEEEGKWGVGYHFKEDGQSEPHIEESEGLEFECQHKGLKEMKQLTSMDLETRVVMWGTVVPRLTILLYFSHAKVCQFEQLLPTGLCISTWASYHGLPPLLPKFSPPPRSPLGVG